MNDQLTTLLGGFPNGAVVLDGSGKLVAHLRWAEPFAIRRAVEPQEPQGHEPH
jgi:hypothetical protein